MISALTSSSFCRRFLRSATKLTVARLIRITRMATVTSISVRVKPLFFLFFGKQSYTCFMFQSSMGKMLYWTIRS